MEQNGRLDELSFAARHVDDICDRRRGLMVVERYIDLQDDTCRIGLTA